MDFLFIALFYLFGIFFLMTIAAGFYEVYWDIKARRETRPMATRLKDAGLIAARKQD